MSSVSFLRQGVCRARKGSDLCLKQSRLGVERPPMVKVNGLAFRGICDAKGMHITCCLSPAVVTKPHHPKPPVF